MPSRRHPRFSDVSLPWTLNLGLLAAAFAGAFVFIYALGWWKMEDFKQSVFSMLGVEFDSAALIAQCETFRKAVEGQIVGDDDEADRASSQELAECLFGDQRSED